MIYINYSQIQLMEFDVVVVVVTCYFIRYIVKHLLRSDHHLRYECTAHCTCHHYDAICIFWVVLEFGTFSEIDSRKKWLWWEETPLDHLDLHQINQQFSTIFSNSQKRINESNHGIFIRHNYMKQVESLFCGIVAVVHVVIVAVCVFLNHISHRWKWHNLTMMNIMCYTLYAIHLS